MRSRPPGRPQPVARAARAALGSAAVTWGVRRLGEVVAPAQRWTRTNHRGEPISLLEGPSVAAGLVAGALLGAEAGPDGGARRRAAAAGAIAAAGGAVFGLVDDLSEDSARARKGLRGHLGALAHGELTTGGLKVLGIGATSVVAAAVASSSGDARGAVGRTGDVLVSGALIASCANLVNLLDLRPGRALKAGCLAALPALGSPTAAPAAAACLGAAGAAAPRDLAEQDMLGDGGANALGALVGTAAVLAAPRPLRVALLALTVGLTVASERVSFTEVIARTPVLRELDAWGRR